jgi:hypothetical protein
MNLVHNQGPQGPPGDKNKVAVFGIDPGIRGGSAFVMSDDYTEIIDLTAKNGLTNLANALIEWSKTHSVVVYLESMGRSRNMKLVKHHDLIEGITMGLRKRTVKVPPNTWQIFYDLGGKQGPEGCTESQEYRARKKAHVAKAREKYPDITEQEADAMLIAIYGFFRETQIDNLVR